MRKAAASGNAAQAGKAIRLAYNHAANASTTHPAATHKSHGRTRAGVCGIAVIIAFALAASLAAKEPPADLAKRVAHRETETEAERAHYTYTQSLRLQELDRSGVQAGEYREVREVIFSPSGERTERFSGTPLSRLKNLVMTDEDFSDLRDVQPLILTQDRLFIYETQYKGEEPCLPAAQDARDCWVLSVRPRQI